MHRFVLYRPSCCRSVLRWHFCQIHIRRLSNTGTVPVPVVHSDRDVVATSEPWQDSDGKVLANKEEDAKDVLIDDLSATLEAHRASNRAAVIRKVIDPRDSFRRLSLGKGGDEGREPKKVREGKEKRLSQMWPRDSVSAKKQNGRRGTRGTKKFTKKSDMSDLSEYEGTLQQLQKSWKISKQSKDRELQRPWLAYIETTGEDNLERLTNEIKAYESYMRLSPLEEAASELIISDLKSVAHDKPEVKTLTLLGSRTTGLATPISDFDFTLTSPTSLSGEWMFPPSEDSVPQPQPSNKEIKVQALKGLRKMAKCLEGSKSFRNIEIIRHARVPIIRSKHVGTGLDVQIQTMASYQAAHEYTIAYLSEFPSLRPLYVVIRYCLELRGLTTVFEGGLGSYAIFMMIVTALKHSSGKHTLDDLGGQLLHVLQFYSTADLYKHGFSANPPRVFEKQKQAIHQMQTLYPRRPYLLCLQDPANEMNDLGKSSHAIKHIQAHFAHAKRVIEIAWERKPDDRTSSCLDGLVRADYRAFELQRSRIEHFASHDKLSAGDYSVARVRKEFHKRVNRYKGIPETDDDIAEPEEEVSGGSNPADSAEVNVRKRLPDDTLAWCHDQLVQSRRKHVKAPEKAAPSEKTENKTSTPMEDRTMQELGWRPRPRKDIHRSA